MHNRFVSIHACCKESKGKTLINWSRSQHCTVGFSCRCQDGVLWCRATLHNWADRPASATSIVWLDQTPDPPGFGISGETGSRAPDTFLWQSLSPSPGSYLCNSSCTILFIFLFLLSHISYHSDPCSWCCTVTQQQLRCLISTLVPTWCSSKGVCLRSSRRGVGSGGEGGGVHEVHSFFNSIVKKAHNVFGETFWNILASQKWVRWAGMEGRFNNNIWRWLFIITFLILNWNMLQASREYKKVYKNIKNFPHTKKASFILKQ